MEKKFNSRHSSLDKFLNEVTTNILKYAIEKVGDMSEDVDLDNEDDLIEQISQDLLQDSVLNSSITAQVELLEMKSDFREMANKEIYAKCCKLVEDITSEAYNEVQRILASSEGEASADNITASRKKLQLLVSIKNSERLQNYFQDISVRIIQDALDKVRAHKKSFSETCETSGRGSDIGPIIDERQGNNLVCQKLDQNMADSTSVQELNYLQLDLIGTQDNCLPENGLHVNEKDSMAELSFYSVQNESSYLRTNNTDKHSSNVGGFTTADSMLLTTANEQKSYKGQSSEDTFVSFDNELFKLKPEQQNITENTPRRQQNEDVSNKTNFENLEESDLEKTLTDSGPRQSTPLANNHCLRTDQQNLPSAETSNLTLAAFHVFQDIEHEPKSDRAEIFTDDESSIGDPSSPGTISRQSSALGNVTLEFDTEWEHGMQNLENKQKAKEEEKHTVILRELSFDERPNLKAPELLGPVFLAVQDDDEDEESERKRKHRLSQSIDDLCEMISEDEGDQRIDDLPLRRRAMSLECRKPPAKAQRKKVPTKEELMQAFQDLRNEILEDKDLNEVLDEAMEGNKPNEVDEEENESMTGEDTCNKQDEDQHVEDNPKLESGLLDPLRWQTVVFNGQHKVIDLKLLEPYLKVLTHGGYHHDGDKKTVIVVLTACNLPSKRMKRYPLLMEQLFFFIISTMDILVTSEEYIFVYFHGGTNKHQSPGLSWLKKYYQYINRRLRKSVTKVYVVHPNLWLKSVFQVCRPFLSSNFARKLKFVSTLQELSTYIKTDFIYIPDEVIRVDPDYKRVHSS